MSKYNKNSVCYQQPLLKSQLTWPPEREEPVIQLPRPVSRRGESHRPERRPSLASRVSQRTRSKSRKSTSRRPIVTEPENTSRDASFDFIHHKDEEENLRAISPVQRKRLSPFRPIQLSIYLPGKELPALPKFSDEDPDDDDEVPPVPEIPRPAKALLEVKSEPMENRRLSSFSIPRKPVSGSRGSSLELTPATRPSIDSGLTLNNNDAAYSMHKRSTSIDRFRNDYRPSISASKSAQEFLEIINAPLPPLPKPTPTSHETRGEFAPKSAFSIYKSASDQNMRLRTHLEQRQEVCDTITEKAERSPVSPMSPPHYPLQTSSTFLSLHRPSSLASRSSQIYVQQSFQQRDSMIHPAHRLSNINNNNNNNHNTTPAWTDSGFELPLPNFHKARSSAGSSTLNNDKMGDQNATDTAAAAAAAAVDADYTGPTVTTTISVLPQFPPSPSTFSHRLSQWLARSITTKQTSTSNSNIDSAAFEPRASSPHLYTGVDVRRKASSTWDLSTPAPLSIGPGAITLPGEIKKSRSVPNTNNNNNKTRPTIGPALMTTTLTKGHTKQLSSVDTYVVSPDSCVDEHGSPFIIGGDEKVAAAAAATPPTLVVNVDRDKMSAIPIVTERRVSSTVGIAF